MRAQTRLIDKLCRDLMPGKVEWLGLRTGHRQAVSVVAEVNAHEGQGLEGDHRFAKTRGSARQVSIISREFVQQIADHMGLKEIDPALLRRNILVSGVNLNALRYQRIKIGTATFEASAQCHPCSRMETALGKGAVAAMMGYGGLCLKVVDSGSIRLGDEILKLDVISSDVR
ncbi:MAG: MOSC domain-containing protein YiiM [Flavobacteriales bacterium]|jgi:MOSC domain-containing protein YiiM